MSKSNKGNSVTGMIILVVLAIIIIVGLVTIAKPVSNTKDIGSAASLSLISPSGVNVEVGQLNHIKWTSENYIAPTVALNVIKKTGTNPNTYELVRTISGSTTNDGDAIWVPAGTDQGDNILIEVGCTRSSQACEASESSRPLAIIDTGRNANTAAAYQAIEQSMNK